MRTPNALRVAHGNRLEPGRQADETATEYLRRVVGSINHEAESFLGDLPTVGAVLEFFGLWAKYDTDLMEGMLEAIATGDDPRPLQRFIAKYSLPWTIDHVLPGGENYVGKIR